MNVFFQIIFKLKLHWQILIGMTLGVLCGLLTTQDNIQILAAYEFIGEIFIKLLKMIIVPLVAASIITGVLSLGSGSSLGKIGLRTIIYYITTSLLAIVTGLILVNIFTPGIQDGNPVGSLLGFQESVSGMSALAEGSFTDIINVFKRMIPANPIEAAAKADVLPIIFFSILLGLFIPKIGKKYAELLTDFWKATFDVMMAITHFIIKFAPIGVFGLVAATITKTGLSSILPLCKYALVVLAGLAIHFFITLPLILRIFAKTKPWLWQHKKMLEALLTAFSTSSSQATLPITIKCVEENVGVSNKISSFVLPLGATINMDGTALYEC
ncbi:MAG: dicarboxylate/amino acid:cation symporter, partial [bacterium]